MVAHSSSPLSFEALAHALAFLAVFNKTLPACERALQRGINLDALRFQYTYPLREIMNDPNTLLGRSLMAVLTLSTTEDYASRIERMLREEFALFLQQTDDRTQERCDILTQLVAPADVVGRIQELCFFPGVLFPWCMVVVQLTTHIRTWNRTRRTALQTIKQSLTMVNDLLPGTLMFPLGYGIDALLELLQEVDNCCNAVDDWRKRLGIDKQVATDIVERCPVGNDMAVDVELPYPYQLVSIAPQTQRIWSYLFKELVDLLRPYCSGPKHWHLQDPGTMPQEAFDRASRLMHLSHPELWDNRPDLIKSRYYAYR